MSWILDSLAKWGIEPAPDCHLCAYLSQQLERVQADLLETRLLVADGPRGRVQELERNLAEVNERLARHNGNGAR
jgi:hypothetical protein